MPGVFKRFLQVQIFNQIEKKWAEYLFLHMQSLLWLSLSLYFCPLPPSLPLVALLSPLLSSFSLLPFLPLSSTLPLSSPCPSLSLRFGSLSLPILSISFCTPLFLVVVLSPVV